MVPCGLLEAGHIDYPASVTGDLYCAVHVNYEAGVTRCAPCTSTSTWMAPPCATSREGIVDDAGNCLLSPDASFSVGCGQAGRRPEGLASIDARGTNARGRMFAEQAALEAASVVAFDRLSRELRAFGAPEDLAVACERAAREEDVHAAIASELAARYGGITHVPTIAPPRSRTLVDFAIENAVEGLVHETYAAAIAVHQGRTARDPVVRSAMQRIAVDELSHADLSRRIHRWVEGRLTAEENALVRDALRDAARALDGRALVEADLAAARDVGLPDGVTALRLVRELEARVWSADAA
jgi:hypothetical protein